MLASKEALFCGADKMGLGLPITLDGFGMEEVTPPLLVRGFIKQHIRGVSYKSIHVRIGS